MIMGDKFLMTTPDFDHSTRLKIMIVGFDPEEIGFLTSKIQLLPHSLTLYSYSDDDNDIPWCLHAARQSDAILVNTRPSSIDQIKGFLLAMGNSSSYGQTPIAHKNYSDMAIWLTDVMLRIQKVEPDQDEA